MFGVILVRFSEIGPVDGTNLLEMVDENQLICVEELI